MNNITKNISYKNKIKNILHKKLNNYFYQSHTQKI